MGSVLKSCLSVHQRRCYYRLRSPATPGPSLFFWVPEIPNTSQKTRGLGLFCSWVPQRWFLHLRGAARCYQGNCPRACPSGTLSLPSCPPFLGTEWELKGSCSEKRSHSVNWCQLAFSPHSPWGEEGGLPPPGHSTPGCAQHTFRDAPICNSLLS